MNSRKLFLLSLTLGTLVVPRAADAQQPKKTSLIGFLASSSVERTASRLAAFQQALRELGYLEGKNIFLERRYAAGQFQKLPGLAAELVGLKVDVLVAEGAPAAHAAKDATSVIPIVMGNAADPVGTGLVASLAHPGGNVTGLATLQADLAPKRLQLLKDIVPQASRVAVLLNPANPTNPLQLKETQAAAPALRVTLLPLEVKEADDIIGAFATMGKGRPGGLIVIGDPLFGSQQRRIVELAAKSRLPAIYSTRPFVDAGGLMSYGTNFDALYRRAAIYVDKILKGTKPADLPVEQPTRFELVINLKTARALGLTIPPSVLVRADQVIQ